MNPQLVKGQEPKYALLEQIEILKADGFTRETALETLVSLVQYIRPRFYHDATYAQHQLMVLIDKLKSDPEALHSFKKLFHKVFSNSEIAEILTDSGIPKSYGFFSELNTRFKRKLLPPLKDKGSFLYSIDSIFYANDDYKWINEVDFSIWMDLFELFEFNFKNSGDTFFDQISFSLRIVCYTITTLSVEPDFKKHLNLSEQKAFIDVSEFTNQLIALHHPEEQTEEYLNTENRLLKQLDYCELIISNAKEKNAEQGTGLQQSFLQSKVSVLIERARLIIQLNNIYEKVDIKVFVTSFFKIVENENTKNSIRRFIRMNMQLLAYRISEHEHDTGEHYITSDLESYKEMFRSAAKGGSVVSVLAMIKDYLHHLSYAPFWEGFAYSTNYSLGFLGIHFSGGTLATKQPAMTASTIAGALDKRKKGAAPNIPELAILFSQVWRSQTASFAGNLVTVFPIAMLLAFLWSLISGSTITDPEFATYLITSVDPFESKSILYACYTGLFLYLSGIISGWVDNKVLYADIPQRMVEHPMLKRSFSKRFMRLVSTYIGKNLGVIMGNVSLGVMLGMFGFIGLIFGFDFDIRHITFSTGNLAIGIHDLGFKVPFAMWMPALIGVFLIGFFNFIVSFSLAFGTALMSRGIRFRQYRKFAHYTKLLLFKYPMDFIYPPKNARKPDDFIKPKNQDSK